MSRILHLSDLHFGTVDARLVGPLLDLARRLAPDLCVVSGDLTQRARADQFRAARAFLDRLPAPVLLVPGNHDMPLYNLPLRLVAPLARYRRAFGPLTEPQVILPDAVVQGLDTANPLVWKSGRLRRASIRRLERAFSEAPAGHWRVAVMHHAPVPAADGTPADIADPAGTLAALARAGAEIVLSGHTHMPHMGLADTAAGVLFLQVGTALSTRLKTGSNDLALLSLSPGEARVESWLSAPGARDFEPGPARTYRRRDGVWNEVDNP
ncbi:MAG: metallophosphoesterase family protein [Tabrizicola flagellatus]|uniref:metallophosphoesterase family protein n=1 Tax=Tabrizicola flagellatus TaxID=2593021 RepID=UPI00391A6C61